MELNILKEEKESIDLELKGETHTLANALKDELYEDDKVKSAAYLVAHPLTDSPRLLVRTASGRTAKASVKNAAERLEKKANEFAAAFKKLK